MLPGDAARGQALFTGKGQCQNCHSVAGVGARGGPSLSESRARRGVRSSCSASIVDPSADIRSDHRPVRVVTRDGATITGRLLNQDTFTIQLLDASARLRLLDKSAVREVAILKESPMPSYQGQARRAGGRRSRHLSDDAEGPTMTTRMRGLHGRSCRLARDGRGRQRTGARVDDVLRRHARAAAQSARRRSRRTT